MSNLHAISSRALTNRSGARKFNIYSVYNELQQWNAFVDKPLKSHDVIVFHKDNRFSYIHSPLAPVPLLLWRYISCHRLDFTPRVTMSLTQIYIKFRTIIFTLLQPNCSPNATQWYDFVDEKKIPKPATFLSAFTEPFRVHNGVSARNYRFCHWRCDLALFSMHTRPKWSVALFLI